jgi:hypothetical protein
MNDGTGRFSRAELPDKGRLGMVTDAVWLPTKNQLVVVGEWMPITTLNFNETLPSIMKLTSSGGWWKTVATVNVDGENGYDGLLLGNEGLNTNLHASIKQPLELYVKDFDENQDSEAIMAYYKNDRKWVYPDLDILAKQMVSLRKQYTDYATFSNRPFSELFSPIDLENSQQLTVQTLASTYIDINSSDLEVHPLPNDLQWSCLQAFTTADFDQDGQVEAIAVGNFSGNTTSIGRSDGSFGHYLKWENEAWKSVPLQDVGFAVEGECRATEVIRGAGGTNYLLVVRNQASPVLFKYRN